MLFRKIIHISDLHISHEVKSVLQKEKYLNAWMNSVNEAVNTDTLIISGDIVNRGGSEDDYAEALKFIEYVKKNSSIKHIICVPGNHDVNRDLLGGIKGDKGIDKKRLWSYYDVKLKYYWEFADKIGLNTSSRCGIVCYQILENPNIVILGLDSTDKIGITDELGSINIESLRTSLNEIFGTSKKNYSEYTKIAVFHHRPIVYQSASQRYDQNNNSKTGQYGTCDADNWKQVKQILLQYDIHTLLTGHVHGTQSGQMQDFEQPNDEIYYSTVGSLGVDFSVELKEKLDKNQDQELLEKLDKMQCYESLNGNHNAYNILSFNENGLMYEEQYKFIVDEGEWKWILWKKKDKNDSNCEDIAILEEGLFSDIQEEVPVQEKIEIDYENEITKIVQENKLYKTGHYHWKGAARLNWIDTTYFFQHREATLLIMRGICCLFEKEKSLQNTDHIIGMGIKGSIMLSYVRSLFPNIKCSYYPENPNEYNKFEKKILESEPQHSMSSVVLLTDVIHTGKTVIRLVNENRKKMTADPNISIITIFDTTPYGVLDDQIGLFDLKIFPLAKIKIADCHNGYENCKIYTNKLAYVYEYKED